MEVPVLFNGLFGIGRAYKKLPPHHNFTELAANIESLANHLLDVGAGNFATGGTLRASERWQWQLGNDVSGSSERWQWQLGNDLKLLLEYARGFVPPDRDGLHYFSGRGYSQPPRFGVGEG
jgi:hypothetical protein